ncbi:ribonuclease H-like domain-containing protein [Tricharina praecox]|uniref:ribonuclease H-like domain-containing protein n=1 Tax=Tricharina praecox TaxID=43433 RepID=UPI0022202D8F|nr:ribonuclease H-like domain-containing protein [Tricharina praecox]KAI5848350.1 ribonuclease H-like domain-containing protein [Tricharina praecox]
MSRNAPGCVVFEEHNVEDILALEANLAFARTPVPIHGCFKRRAVVIDCEMGGDQFGQSELILLSVVDFFTGEVLVDSLVDPSTAVTDWRTRCSSVTGEAMDAARASGNVLRSWQGAWDRLLQFIDSETVVVGFALENNLDQLRLIHPNVVDARLAIPRLLGGGKHGVRALMAELLGKDVQNPDSDGHNCLEDVFAARELILWCVMNPEKLEVRKLQSQQLLDAHIERIRATAGKWPKQMELGD